MKIALALVPMLACGALSAQEAGNLDARIQVFADVVQPKSFTYYTLGGGVEAKTEAKRQTGLGFRLLGELPYTTGWYYELGGRLDSSSHLKLSDKVVDATDIQMTYSYWSAGVGYLWYAGPLSFGVHLEGRGEAISLKGEEYEPAPSSVSRGQVSASTSYIRPWARGSVDVTFGSGKVRPYVGGEMALALMRTTQTRVPSFTMMQVSPDNRTLRAMAPNFTLGAYFGLRF